MSSATRDRIRLLSMRLALAMANSVNRKCDLRSAGRRKRPLVMVWTLNAGPQATAPLLADIDRFLQVADVTVVTDTLHFEPFHLRGCMIEVLPGAALRDRLPTENWPLYTERRITRIRASWQPDIETYHQIRPEQFIAELQRKIPTIPDGGA